jgi:hypothetical protein
MQDIDERTYDSPRLVESDGLPRARLNYLDDAERPTVRQNREANATATESLRKEKERNRSQGASEKESRAPR